MKNYDLVTLAQFLNDENDVIREKAAEALVKFGDKNKEILQELIDAVRDSNDFVSIHSACSISKLKQEAQEAISALVYKARTSKSKAVKIACINAIGEIGVDSKVANNFLFGLIKNRNSNFIDKYEEVRIESAKAMGKIGFEEKEILLEFFDMLQDKSVNIRYSAQMVLVCVGKKSKPVREFFMQKLRIKDNKDKFIHKKIISIFSEIGPDAKDSISAIRPFLYDKNQEISNLTRNALFRIGPLGPRKNSFDSKIL